MARSQPGGNRFDRLVGAIYGAGLGELPWSESLAHLTGFIGGVAGELEVFDHATDRCLLLENDGLPADGVADYLEYFQPLSPRLDVLKHAPAGHVGYDRQVLTEGDMDRNEFYADFLAPADMRYFISGTVRNDPRYYAVVGVQRARAHGHVEAREVDALRRLLPHFRRALSLAADLDAPDRKRAPAARLLETSRSAVWFLDRWGRVTTHNAAADRLLTRRRAIRQCGTTLQLRAAASQRAFERRLSQALAPPHRSSSSRPHRPLYFACSGAPMALDVVPLVGVDALAAATGGAVAAVLVREVGTGPDVNVAAVGHRYGLTPAERRLADALLNGCSLREHAVAESISYHTARTHLTHLLDKTQTRSQADLVRLLAAFPAHLI